MLQDDFQYDYYYLSEELIPGVSRTFDYTLRKLPCDLLESSNVAYAYCRVLDTLEDSMISSESRLELMNEVVSAFSKRDINAAKNLEERLGLINQKKKEYRELMKNYSRVVGASGILDDITIRLIAQCGREMADGLSSPLIQKIVTLKDHHRYCHYAAAVVGYFITKDMLTKGYLSREQSKRLMPFTRDNNPSVGENPAHDFAVALQLTNNIKDLHDDYKNGIYRWPSALLDKYGLTFEDIINPQISGDKKERALNLLSEQIDDAKKYFPSATLWVDLIPFDAKGKTRSSIEGIKHSWGDALAFSAATLREIGSDTFFTDRNCRKIGRREIMKIDKLVGERVREGKKIGPLVEHLFSKTVYAEIND